MRSGRAGSSLLLPRKTGGCMRSGQNAGDRREEKKKMHVCMDEESDKIAVLTPGI